MISDNAIQATAVSKNFGDVKALDKVNLQAARGKVTGLLGPNGAYLGAVGLWTGLRWTDGAPASTGHTTILGPNKSSCTDGGDDRDGIFEPSSLHTGGVHVLLGDGTVRFVSDNIDTGNPTLGSPLTGVSPYGIWGSLGSVNGGEVVNEF